MRRTPDGPELPGTPRSAELVQANHALMADLTKPKRVEQVLRRQKEVIQTIFDHIPVMLNLFDASGQLLLVNREWERAMGWALREANDRDVLAGLYTVPEYRQTVLDYIRAASCGWQHFRLRVRDGQTLDVSWANVRLSDGTCIGIGQDISERRRVEEALRESEEKYRQLFEATSDPVVLIDSENNQIMDANTAACQLYGYSRDELLRLKTTDVSIELKETAKRTRHASEVTLTPSPASVRHVSLCWHRKRDGTVFPVEIAASIFCLRGRSVHIAAIRDSTERRRAEEALRLTQFSVDQAPDAIIWYGPNGRLLHANEQASRLLGYSPQEFLSPTVSDFDPIVPRAIWSQRWEEVKNQRPVTFESVLRRKDSTCFPVEVNANHLQFGGQEWVVGFARDTTEHKAAEEALQASEERRRAVVANSPDMVFYQDRDLRYRWVPSGPAPFSHEDVVGKTDCDLLSRDTLEHLVSVKRQVLEEGVGQKTEVGALVQGKQYYYLCAYEPFRDPEGKVVGLLGYLRDITARREAEMVAGHRLAMEELIGVVSTRFINVSVQEMDGEIGQTLRAVGEFAEVDRLCVMLLSRDGVTIERVYEWCAEGIAPHANTLAGTSIEPQAWVMTRLRQQEVVSVPRVADLPPEAHPEKQMWQARGTRSVLSIPLAVGSTLIGFLELNSCHTEKTWAEEDIRLVTMLAGVLVNALERLRAEQALRRERQMMESVAQGVGVGLCVISRDYRAVWANGVLHELFGDVEGKPCHSMYVQQPSICPGCGVREIFEREAQRVVVEQKVLTADGEPIWFELIATPVRDERGQVVGALEAAVPITERKRTEQKLRQSEERYRLLAENAQDVVYRLRLRPTFGFDYVSPAITALTGFSPEEYYADPELGLRVVHPDDRPLLTDKMRAINPEPKSVRKPLELRWVNKEGAIVWLELRSVPVYDEDGNLVATEGIARDITERKRAEETMRHLTFHDGLTGLYNRAFFEEELNRLEGGRDYPVTVVAVDIDGLKLVNDTLGHQQGDELLKVAARVLTSSFRSSDVVARVGGDEFTALLPRSDSMMGEELCRRLEEQVEAYNSAHPKLHLSLSSGIATATGPSQPLANVLQKADADMYRDKLHHGPNGTHGIVKALLTALAIKDYGAEGHVARVKDMAVQLGRACHLSSRELTELELLAEVHDLGKVGVPDGILLKPGPLTAEEQAQMQQHPALGCRIARASPELGHIAELILHHHERWDGKGYPAGLSLESIPTACRILAIVDAYDAMTNDRPYHKAMGREQALQEVRRCAGTQFDPSLVEAFVPLISDAVSGAVLG